MLCFGQLAAAYLGLGLVIGSGTLLAYLVTTVVPKLRSKEWGLRRTAVTLGALAVAFLVVNVAYYLPRLAYTPRTTVGLGYGRLDAIAQALLGSGLALSILCGLFVFFRRRERAGSGFVERVERPAPAAP